MFIDTEILDHCGSTQERLKEIFTAKPCDESAKDYPDLTDEQRKKKTDDYVTRKKFETMLGDRLMEQINFSMRNYNIYAAVDLAWDSTPINKTTYPLMLYAQGKLDLAGCCGALSGLSNSERYLQRNAKKEITGINLPKFLEVNINLIRSFITRRLAAQTNKYNNLYPFYKYESRSTGLVGKLRADVVSQRMDIMADQFDYRHHDTQVYRDTFLYGHCVDFMRCAWEKEVQWVKQEVPEALETDEVTPRSIVAKEGLAFVNPHPTRVFWDNAYPLASINTDTGCEYIGFWDVQRYGDIEGNPMYWNRADLAFSSNVVTLFSTYASYFSTYYCTIRPPQAVSDLSGLNDRKNNIGIYSGQTKDTSILLTNFFVKIKPKEWGVGDYPYPVWLRCLLAGENTVIHAEFMPTTPAAYCGLNENDNRQVNISVAHELMSYQDQMTNLQSYLLQCILSDNIKVLVVDTDVASSPEVITAFRDQIKGRDYNAQAVILEVSRAKLLELNMDPAKVVSLVETKCTSIDIIFRAMIQLVQMVERLMALSPQEQGQPAPREISATETNLIAGTTESVFAFISDAFDEYRAAKKRICYEAYMARGTDRIRVPVINRYTEDVIKKAGFDVVPDEMEDLTDATTLARRHTIIGSKTNLLHDFIFTSRDGAERSSNAQSANTLVQLLSILQNPMIAEAIGKEKLYEIVNEIFRMSGSGLDLKLEVQEGESNQLGLDRFQQIQQIAQNLTDMVGQNQQDIRTVSDQAQKGMQGMADKNQKDIESLKELIQNLAQQQMSRAA